MKSTPGRKFGDRLEEYICCIQKQKEPIGEHFCSRNHSTIDLKAQIIENLSQIHPNLD
jgi:hypothetical protein